MKRQLFGALVASTLTGLLAAGSASAEDKAAAAKAKPAATKAPAAGKCVHSCQGYAECKGNGSNSCKGKNSCANTGLVPKACSAKTDADSCGKVVDAKSAKMCSWYES
jgi:hypothetical protein